MDIIPGDERLALNCNKCKNSVCVGCITFTIRADSTIRRDPCFSYSCPQLV